MGTSLLKENPYIVCLGVFIVNNKAVLSFQAPGCISYND